MKIWATINFESNQVDIWEGDDPPVLSSGKWLSYPGTKAVGSVSQILYAKLRGEITHLSEVKNAT